MTSLTLEIAIKGELHVLPGFLYGKLYHEEYDGLPGLMEDVCESLEQSGLVEFVVGGFGKPRWYTDVEVDLMMLVENDLPNARWRADRDQPFRLNFIYHDSALEFEPDRDDYVVTFATSGMQPGPRATPGPRPLHWTRDPNTIRMPKYEVRAMLTRLAEDFCKIAETACPAATRHPLYQAWRKELMQETRPRDLDAETTPDET